MRIPNHLQASRNPAHSRGLAFLVGVGLLAAIFVTPALWAQQLNQLADFNGPNGNNPGGKLAMDAAGNIYGTTFYGGSNYCSYGCGTVYKLSKHGSQWMLSSLYDFRGGQDGAHPWGGITLGPDGALYGTTYGGGLYGDGAVFKLQPQANRCKTALCYWTETVIYNFTGGSDGGTPQGDVIFDSAGNIYGTTQGGGLGSNGVVYELSAAQGSLNINVLYRFQGGADGQAPEDGVVMDVSGNLFGTTFLGGTDSVGVVYELSQGESGWTETVLHSFAGGDDGKYPGVPVVDPSGNVFGATSEDGANGDGTVFELQPTGGGFSYSIIYQFNSLAGPPCDAECGFTLDSAGNLYSAGYGGMNGGGTIFELSPSNGSWNLTVLWDLNEYQGLYPSGRPILDAQGNLYGTTEYGGVDFDGNVWQLTP